MTSAFIAKLNLAQRQIPIVVKLPAEARQDLSLLARLTVPGKHGPVMIANVATLEITGGPAEIDRYDRLRDDEADAKACNTTRSTHEHTPSNSHGNLRRIAKQTNEASAKFSCELGALRRRDAQAVVAGQPFCAEHGQA